MSYIVAPKYVRQFDTIEEAEAEAEAMAAGAGEVVIAEVIGKLSLVPAPPVIEKRDKDDQAVASLAEAIASK